MSPLGGQMLGRDFSNLWFAGQLALSGNAACAFDVGCFRSALADSPGITTAQNYSHPPHALFIALPFATLPYYAALALWTLADILFFSLCALPFLPRGFPSYLAAFTTAGWPYIWNGHYRFLIGGL